MEGTARASFDWARRVGSRWRRCEQAPSSGPAAALLAEAFGERRVGREAGPLEQARQHDRSVAVAAVLAGLSPRELGCRARRRTGAFAQAAAEALELAEREAQAFATARRCWERIGLDWQEGVAAGLEGWSDPARGPLFQLARREARAALARQETWAVVASFRAPLLRREGFVDAALERVDVARLLSDGSYRAGAHLATLVRSTAGEAALEAELRSLRPRSGA